MSHDSGTRTVVAKAALTYPETPLGLDERFWSKVEGAPRWHAHAVYAAVRLFGWAAWRRSSRSN